ncbi:MAG: VOC family protein [Rhodocyclaceae bacterium]|nr:VOC family protein [Rhodocyclaceae bacterium]
MAAVDHLVVAAADLESGSAWLESRLGARLAGGGRHAAMGTHNRLLRLGEGHYLELIAIDPEAPAPGRRRWFDLDSPAMATALAERPRLVHWVARTPDLAGAAATCREPLGDLLSMARGDFRWRITVAAGGAPPLGGLLPSLIQWELPFHPADRLPESGCRLMKLEAFADEPARLRAALADLGLERHLDIHPANAEQPAQLVAYLETPRGLVELD